MGVAGISLAALIAGCSGIQLERAVALKPGGSEYSRVLFDGYIDLSRSEYDEGDYPASDVFALRAIAAASGEIVGPEAISERDLPAPAMAELTGARSRLMAALNVGARHKAPADAARAMLMFDCWMQEQEENFQLDQIAYCRDGFLGAVGRIEASLEPPPVASATEPALPAPDAAMPAERRSRRFVVYFGFDSAGISGVARKAILEAAGRIGARRVFISGHTDRAGANRYNLALSERRARAVVAEITGQGVSSGLVSFGSFGEFVPAVVTKDGVALRKNRRVEIDIAN